MDEAVDAAVEGITLLGYQGRVQIRVDNEAGTIALRDAIIARMGTAAKPVVIPPHDSQSNGSVENGIKLFKGLLRVHL